MKNYLSTSLDKKHFLQKKKKNSFHYQTNNCKYFLRNLQKKLLHKNLLTQENYYHELIIGMQDF